MSAQKALGLKGATDLDKERSNDLASEIQVNNLQIYPRSMRAENPIEVSFQAPLDSQLLCESLPRDSPRCMPFLPMSRDLRSQFEKALVCRLDGFIEIHFERRPPDRFGHGYLLEFLVSMVGSIQTPHPSKKSFS